MPAATGETTWVKFAFTPCNELSCAGTEYPLVLKDAEQSKVEENSYLGLPCAFRASQGHVDADILRENLSSDRFHDR